VKLNTHFHLMPKLRIHEIYPCTLVGMNLCIPHLLEVKGKGVRVVADKGAYTVHTINIIFQQQYLVANCLSSYVSIVFGLHSMCICFPSTCKLVT
jgi:hypothetical protein